MGHHKKCIVPSCKNSSKLNKLFIHVPRNAAERQKWLEAVGRKNLSEKTTFYVCEDHFEIEKDVQNYMKFKMMGGPIFIKSGVVPHKNINIQNIDIMNATVTENFAQHFSRREIVVQTNTPSFLASKTKSQALDLKLEENGEFNILQIKKEPEENLHYLDATIKEEPEEPELPLLDLYFEQNEEIDVSQVKNEPEEGEKSEAEESPVVEKEDLQNSIPSTSQKNTVIKSQDKKVHECMECGKKFDQNCKLKAHFRVHSKPFKCNECDKSFAHNYKLQEHLKGHEGTREKIFECNQCEKNFAKKHNLTRHLLCHTGERPFQCDQCKKNFAQKRDLERHKAIHLNERPYFECNECQKLFTQKGNLKTHFLLIHSGFAPSARSVHSYSAAFEKFVNRDCV